MCDPSLHSSISWHEKPLASKRSQIVTRELKRKLFRTTSLRNRKSNHMCMTRSCWYSSILLDRNYGHPQSIRSSRHKSNSRRYYYKLDFFDRKLNNFSSIVLLIVFTREKLFVPLLDCVTHSFISLHTKPSPVEPLLHVQV